jgi:hypothetical protein
MTALYGASIVLYHLTVVIWPEIGQAVAKIPKLNALLSWRSWGILALIILIIFIIDGAQRVQRRKLGKQAGRHRAEVVAWDTRVGSLDQRIGELDKQVAELLGRPKLDGFFHDISPYFYYAEGWPELKQGEKIKPFSPPPILGMEIVMSLRLINNSPAPTTLHSFSLAVECEGKKWLAAHAEEVMVRGSVPLFAMPQASKPRLNFVSYLDAPDKRLTQGTGVDGLLVFRLPGMTSAALPKRETSISLTLYVEDAWGKRHPIQDQWGPSPRPSLKISSD